MVLSFKQAQNYNAALKFDSRHPVGMLIWYQNIHTNSSKRTIKKSPQGEEDTCLNQESGYSLYERAIEVQSCQSKSQSFLGSTRSIYNCLD